MSGSRRPDHVVLLQVVPVDADEASGIWVVRIDARGPAAGRMLAVPRLCPSSCAMTRDPSSPRSYPRRSASDIAHAGDAGRIVDVHHAVVVLRSPRPGGGRPPRSGSSSTRRSRRPRRGRSSSSCTPRARRRRRRDRIDPASQIEEVALFAARCHPVSRSPSADRHEPQGELRDAPTSPAGRARTGYRLSVSSSPRSRCRIDLRQHREPRVNSPRGSLTFHELERRLVPRLGVDEPAGAGMYERAGQRAVTEQPHPHGGLPPCSARRLRRTLGGTRRDPRSAGRHPPPLDALRQDQPSMRRLSEGPEAGP